MPSYPPDSCHMSPPYHLTSFHHPNIPRSCCTLLNRWKYSTQEFVVNKPGYVCKDTKTLHKSKCAIYLYNNSRRYIFFFVRSYIGKSKSVNMYSLNIQEYDESVRLTVHEAVFHIIKTVIILTKFDWTSRNTIFYFYFYRFTVHSVDYSITHTNTCIYIYIYII
jgi:hypothetical protein